MSPPLLTPASTEPAADAPPAQTRGIPVWNEAERLAALDRYGILDTPREPEFDDVASLAADIFDAPIAVVNLIAQGRQWFKAEVGIGADELPLDVSICAHAILQQGIFIVPDTTVDDRFRCNPLVAGDPGLRFYAGALLETPDGLPLGTVCVLDTKTRPEGITERQRLTLEVLARQVMTQLELRRVLAEQHAEVGRARASEAEFRVMADAVPQIVWIIDGEGRNAFFNSHWSDYTGGPNERLTISELVARYVHPDDAQATLTAFEGARQTRGPFTIEHRVRSAAREYRWFLARGEPWSDPDDAALIRWYGTSTDLHDSKVAEARLSASEEQLRLATEAAEVGLWDLDPLSDDLYWPPRVKAMFGISPDAPATMADFFAALHPDDAEAVSEAFASALDPQRRAVYDVEYRALGKEDGRLRWVAAKGRGIFNAEGECVRVIGTALDITGRKRAEQELRELNETLEQRVAAALAERQLFANVVENSTAAITVLGLDYTILAINAANVAAIEKVYGKRAKAGDNLLDLLSDMPEHQAQVATVWGRALAGEEFVVVDEFGDAAHEKVTFEVRFNIVRDREGRQIGASNTAYDVTDRVRAQRELTAAQEALRQSQKMEAMGQLTGGVAHDFNNLLTPILGTLDMLQRKHFGGEREQRLLSGALQSAERARTLVQRLLAFARRQPLQAVPVDIAGLIRDMGDLVASTTGPQIEVKVRAPDGLPAAKADPNQLEMALLNLSVNARDAMPDGGTLRISARAAVVDAGRGGSLAPGRYVCLSVADTGAGMDERTLTRAVEPFFSTKGIGKGTGLGLSMVHGLASQLGGALTIQSRLGLGTNIELWLPQSEAAPEAPEPALQGSAAPAAHGRVLLVDDEEIVRISTADMLSDLGYAVVEAASAEEALALYDKGERFDIVVTDHLMPGMNGTQLADSLSATQPHLRVLLVSGYAEGDDLDPRLPRLTKPFRKDELAASLGQLR
jgi:PAS domain S-box-containing protein